MRWRRNGEDTAAAAERMVRTQIAARGINDEAVLEAMRRVPRHRFVPEHMARSAYADNALPIGRGQTISQPFIVALMTQALELSAWRDADLAAAAQRLLGELGYDVRLIVGDGSNGVPEHAPYAGIVVAAASPGVPQPLVDQLSPGGRMVIPVGERFEQRLIAVQRTGDGFSEQPLEAAVFVPLVGEHGFGTEPGER